MRIDKLRGFAFIIFDDYDSVDRCILDKPHIVNNKELDVRKAIPREQTPRKNPSFSNNNTNPEYYYQSHFMLNHSSPPFAYFHPLINTPTSYSQLNVLSPTRLFFPAEFANNAFIPSPLIQKNNPTQNDNRKNVSRRRYEY